MVFGLSAGKYVLDREQDAQKWKTDLEAAGGRC
jgi:hypothetical protein